MIKSKIVVLTSGGVESTTLLVKAIQEVGKENVYAITFNDDGVFHQLRKRPAIKNIITELSIQQNYFECNIPQTAKLEYPVDDTFVDGGFIPGFKWFMLSAAMSYAMVVGSTKVYVGNMKDNVYRDETLDFVSKLQHLFNDTYAKQYQSIERVELVSPFQDMEKFEVINYASTIMSKKLLAKTFSCDDESMAGSYNCGECFWCSKRKEGFELSDIEDSTPYMNQPTTNQKNQILEILKQQISKTLDE